MQLLNPRRIELSQGKFALVDAEDYPRLSKYNWYYSNGYAVRSVPRGVGRQGIVRMHREIMETTKGMVCDHIDGDGLNNCKANLRNCTQSENIRNRKISEGRLKGVSPYHHDPGKWVARITVNKKIINIGVFIDKIAAANAYNHFAMREHGDFARLNEVPFMSVEEWRKFRTKTRMFPKGVRQQRNGRYSAYVGVSNKQISLGTFDTIEQATKRREEYLTQQSEKQKGA